MGRGVYRHHNKGEGDDGFRDEEGNPPYRGDGPGVPAPLDHQKSPVDEDIAHDQFNGLLHKKQTAEASPPGREAFHEIR